MFRLGHCQSYSTCTCSRPNRVRKLDTALLNFEEKSDKNELIHSPSKVPLEVNQGTCLPDVDGGIIYMYMTVYILSIMRFKLMLHSLTFPCTCMLER